MKDSSCGQLRFMAVKVDSKGWPSFSGNKCEFVLSNCRPLLHQKLFFCPFIYLLHANSWKSPKGQHIKFSHNQSLICEFIRAVSVKALIAIDLKPAINVLLFFNCVNRLLLFSLQRTISQSRCSSFLLQKKKNNNTLLISSCFLFSICPPSEFQTRR